MPNSDIAERCVVDAARDGHGGGKVCCPYFIRRCSRTLRRVAFFADGAEGIVTTKSTPRITHFFSPPSVR
jgi:hypothetical protein